MIIVIDNYDSFTYNLVQYFGELGGNPTVFQNDKISIQEILDYEPSGICISPGPSCPSNAGISNEVIKKLGFKIPILGVCLGHQCIGEVFGAKIIPADQLLHGKISPIFHHGEGVFANLPSPFRATRYNSLIVCPKNIPSTLKITAWTTHQNGAFYEIMGLSHQIFPIWGVQFHPESIASEEGKKLINNFLVATKLRYKTTQ